MLRFEIALVLSGLMAGWVGVGSVVIAMLSQAPFKILTGTLSWPQLVSRNCLLFSLTCLISVNVLNC